MNGPTLCRTKMLSVTENDYASLTLSRMDQKAVLIMNLCKVIVHRFNGCLHQQFIFFF